MRAAAAGNAERTPVAPEGTAHMLHADCMRADGTGDTRQHQQLAC